MFDFEKSPIIAAVRRRTEFEDALSSPPSTIFLLSSDIMSLKNRIQAAKNARKNLFIHIDFCDGLGRDRYGVEYLKSIGVENIISTKTNIIQLAKTAGFSTVQRFFIIDSLSVTTALDTIRNAKPDLVELMPGVIPSAIANFAEKVQVPIIAGGLVQSRKQVSEALEAGAAAVSTADSKLWHY